MHTGSNGMEKNIVVEFVVGIVTKRQGAGGVAPCVARGIAHDMDKLHYSVFSSKFQRQFYDMEG